MVAGAALLALLGWANLPSIAAAEDAIDSDTYFYGQSPPVYPSPEMTGEGQWQESYNKAKALVAKLTMEEKVNLTTGASIGNGCSGNIAPIKRLGFHGMCLTDAGQGVRMTDFVSSFPSGIHVGASWNKELAAQRGVAMGGEAKKKGVNVLLGPVVGPAWRVVKSGRNWESFAADPYLSGALAGQTVSGIQSQDVITSVKHYIANEQESYRTPGIGDVKEAVSSNVDDKTMHELYLWPFQDAVRAGSGNIMCSYQRINNSYGCANSKTMNGLLKTELGFQGFVVSDWGAQHAGVATALSGMDMVMPDGGGFWGDELAKSVKNGSVPESRLDDMATRIVTSWYHFKQDSYFPHPGIGMPKDLFKPHEVVDARDPEARPVLLNGAIEGHVLVKHTKNTLPLQKPRLLSIFGYAAKTPDLYAPLKDAIFGQSWISGAEPINAMDVVEGYISAPDPDFPVIGKNGSMLHGGGSGATAPANFISPFEALRQRTYADGTAVFNDFLSEKADVHPASDACLVFANAWSTEGHDRPFLQDNYTDTLINSVADQCDKTIVIFQNAGPRLVDGFVDHPNVTAIIFAHLPGQDIGPSIVSLLYGESNFSGKLPYTVGKKESDYGELLNPSSPEGKYKDYPQSNFTEGVYTDYKHFEKHNIAPRYEFGFGLSYTTFSITNLQIKPLPGARTDEYPAGTVVTGGQADLFDDLYYVTVELANTGKVAGAEVVQLYAGIPNGPAKQLRGFEKRHLGPGDKTTVTLALNRRDLSTWNTEKQKWQLQRGEYDLFVGNSSKHLPLKANIKL